MIQVVANKFGRLDCLVNNAGITGPRTPIVGYPDDGWHKVLKVDLNSVYFGMKFGLRVMQKQGYGVIINMSSLSGVIGYENVAAYTSSKAAIIGAHLFFRDCPLPSFFHESWLLFLCPFFRPNKGNSPGSSSIWCESEQHLPHRNLDRVCRANDHELTQR